MLISVAKATAEKQKYMFIDKTNVLLYMYSYRNI